MIDSSPDITSVRHVLSDLPDGARVWIYGSDRDLTEAEVVVVRDALSEFLREWSSHGRDVSGQADIIENRFLMVGAHIPSGDISGCGIDKSTRVVTELAEQLGIEWLSSLHVFYHDGDRVRSVSRGEFKRLAYDGDVDADTFVYDLTISELSALRNGQFHLAAGDTWHGPAFKLASS